MQIQEPGLETGARLETEVELETGTRLKAGTGLETSTGLKAGTRLEASTGLKTGTGLDAGSGLKAGTGVEAGAESRMAESSFTRQSISGRTCNQVLEVKAVRACFAITVRNKEPSLHDHTSNCMTITALRVWFYNT